MQEYTVKVHDNGTTYWYQNGVRHREGGPAVEVPGIGKWWYQNGLFHRKDGPAIDYDDGLKVWYLNGIQYTEEEFKLKRKSNKCSGRIIYVSDGKYTFVDGHV